MARVVVDLAPAHLDHPFDYAVPASMADGARPGTRVRVRFAGQDVDAYLVERRETSDHPGPLVPLRRLVSAEQVLTPEVLALARAVADHYAGTLADVLRLAVPPRHARTEGEPVPEPTPEPESEPESETAPDADAPDEPGAWGDYPAGAAFLRRLAEGGAPRAVWSALPGPGWADALAEAAAAALQSGRGALLLVPDRRDLDRLEAAVTARLGPGRHARLEADLGPAARYRAFLSLLRGRVRVAIGTRAAAFAPVADLGLVAIWDDGDPQHAEPRSPYPHARRVLALRAEQSGAAALIGGWARSTEAEALLQAGWAREIAADRAARRRGWARIAAADDSGPADPPAARAARMPPAAWRAVQQGLRSGPVLVQVPRTGYLPSLACQGCRAPARCPHCAGPVSLSGPAAPATPGGPADGGTACGWCARPLVGWRCPHCSGTRLRARAVGVQRTGEELGRAFPGHPVLVCHADRPPAAVPAGGALVLATPGIEPPVPDGYAAAVLLDGDLALARPDLRAAEEALRRWLAAAALVRPAGRGGSVVICADPAAPAVQALIRADPAWLAGRELAERGELRFPPAVAAATVTGPPASVRALVDLVAVEPGVELLGPVPVEVADPVPGAEQVRYLLRAPHSAAGELSAALRRAQGVRSARRDLRGVRVRVDPLDLG